MLLGLGMLAANGKLFSPFSCPACGILSGRHCSVRYNEVPSRGVLATIASDDKSFECHITLSKVKEVKFAKSKAKSGEYDIYATRFLGPDGKVLMSCLLHGNQGVYDPSAVAAWTSLATKYGETVTF
ncbi:hypothetical protein VOLCADRAFT_98770 [Volvox carteri f. nagariensis]|uniref:Uncharacterized protein n=1 Tax=Volvox carteri f. nagariensis TaxID=3068 RepID=D8UG91_VOLCA|nr:uncharacterized protein VOLCADRAFT_98770 [Volvox carteri f. nagariensis]EFJ41219.1 hypothetical protein VOLCADRAFT_98770 [Volvox carteri f. nagariensis]|eukprot:XP_002957670.1 hypothetical protein VOLCADRAFT_98770 [Volvox carteri f. nagariensis]